MKPLALLSTIAHGLARTLFELEVGLAAPGAEPIERDERALLRYVLLNRCHRGARRRQRDQYDLAHAAMKEGEDALIFSEGVPAVRNVSVDDGGVD